MTQSLGWTSRPDLLAAAIAVGVLASFAMLRLMRDRRAVGALHPARRPAFLR